MEDQIFSWSIYDSWWHASQVNFAVFKMQGFVCKRFLCLAPFFITLKILISCGYPLPSLSVKHYLVGNNFLPQIIYTYANTVDRDQVNVNKKISKKQELQITHCTIIPQQYIEPSNCEIMVTNGLFGIKCN